MAFRFLLIFCLFMTSACARLGYLTEQGIEQVKIQWIKDRKNIDILNDPKVPEYVKQKILLVEDYKKFFQHYFSEKSTGIYSRTTMLDTEAVSYLVIASPHTEIKAHEFKFPFVGAFPYIGFFKKSSAESFARKLEKNENLVTYIRPVYAYSTLGYMEDRILSSFFDYNDIELAELIFHELFHTIFFIKNEVELNENLANYYGKEMLREYFKDQNQLQDYFKRQERKDALSERIVELIGLLQTEFDKLGGFLTDATADELTERFVEEVMKPDLRKLCRELNLPERDCEFKHRWNQASFAAFLTYEKEQDFIAGLRDHLKLSLIEFLTWLRKEYKRYQKQDSKESFTEYLKAKVPNATSSVN